MQLDSTKVGDFVPSKHHTKFSAALLNTSLLSLLKHCSGLPAWKNLWIRREQPINSMQEKHQEILDILNSINYDANNRDKFIYSDLGFLCFRTLLRAKGF